ncbi:EEF1A lysine methyltransferase 2, partial [Plecturocebus cupreus]
MGTTSISHSKNIPKDGISPICTDWSAAAGSWLTATSTSCDQAILPQPPSRVAGITGAHHHSQLIFVFLVEMGFCHGGQAGLELLTSGDSPTLASQSARIAEKRCKLSCFVARARVQWRHLGSPQPLTLGLRQSSCFCFLSACHHVGPANFCIFSRDGASYVGQAGLELLTSSDLPASASQSVGIT